MIHVVTVHYWSDRWVDPQLSYLRRHLREPYRTWASLEGVSEELHGRFDTVVPCVGRHAPKLNLIAGHVCAEADDSDLLIFLDGDAFPITDPLPTIRQALKEHALVAVRRDESDGDCQPHPSFAATTVRTWRELPGDWSDGWQWRTASGELRTDVGGNLLRLLEINRLSWHPLLRSRSRGEDPVGCGVYGEVVYHHGAGFRGPIHWTDTDPTRQLWWLKKTRWGRRWVKALRRRWWEKLREERRIENERVYRKLLADPEFFREFL